MIEDKKKNTNCLAHVQIHNNGLNWWSIHLYSRPFLTQSIGFILSLICRAKGYLPVPKNTM